MKRSILAAVLTAVIGLSVAACDTPTERRGNPTALPACQTEDSINCVWNAESQGNGYGRSFVAHADGTVEYLP